MTQDFKKKLCDAGCTLHGTGECGYDTRGIEQNCPYFNYILSGYELMERELLVWAGEQLAYYQKLEEEEEGDPVRWGQRNAFQQVIDKINSL